MEDPMATSADAVMKEVNFRAIVKAAYEEQVAMYERQILDDERSIEKLAPFKTADHKRRRDNLRERQQVAAHKKDALLVLALEAGMLDQNKEPDVTG